MRKMNILVFIFILSLLVTACGQTNASNEKQTLTLGTTEATLDFWKVVKEEAKKQGLTLELKTFTGGVDLNQLTKDGEIDANSFQHLAYLASWNKTRKSELVADIATIAAPLGIYSKTRKSLKDIKKGDKIAIPNDDSNWPRALVLLQNAGLIKLKDDFNGQGGEDKILENPYNLDIVPAQAANLPRLLDDVDAAVINNGVALEAGYKLTSSLYHESKKEAPYVNIVAVTKDVQKKKRKELDTITEILHSKKVTDYITKHYEGNFLPVTTPIDQLLKEYDKAIQKEGA
ncbi:MetQ/NlpA family ABC transporter substrate-binding protein [Bacillus safensis]|uniref:MetQ/NlpA family ABC transporter substrate-binding protein n=1 Tax=Bacillus safensis TaxID=561879 RepID=UPI002075C2D0|nr:MetQ/NlpA family ABC transporter substrate-binding protein [Bacillus safensis]USD82730.1 MetQ/NlpA family ABC transporter substrate-binding protein [Bacillus safensis]